jgi:hypothetical protein
MSVLKPDQIVPRVRGRLDQLIDFSLKRSTITVLSRLKDRKQQQGHYANRQIGACYEKLALGQVRYDANCGQQDAQQQHRWPTGAASAPGREAFK